MNSKTVYKYMPYVPGYLNTFNQVKQYIKDNKWTLQKLYFLDNPDKVQKKKGSS